MSLDLKVEAGNERIIEKIRDCKQRILKVHSDFDELDKRKKNYEKEDYYEFVVDFFNKNITYMRDLKSYCLKISDYYSRLGLEVKSSKYALKSKQFNKSRKEYVKGLIAVTNSRDEKINNNKNL